MRWKKLGNIFNPTEFNLPNGCKEFAKSPQALVYEGFVRIYYCAAEREVNGKLLSRVQFVDFDKSFTNVIQMSESEVLPLGKLGTFDEHGIFPFNVLRYENRTLAFTAGWNRKSAVSVDGAIGFAESFDNGLTFKKFGDGPIVAPNPKEPFLVSDPFVITHNDQYFMYYIYGVRWVNCPTTNVPQRVYKIALATSSDGMNWQRDSKPILKDVINQDECQALPTIFFHEGKYHMYFCYRDAIGFREYKEKSYRFGYAFSTDLINWERADEKSGIEHSKEGWDSEMMCYPNVFKCDQDIYMLYNGNEFGRYGFGLAKLLSTAEE